MMERINYYTMSKVYIVSAKRSPIGSFNGSLSTVPATALGATVAKDAIASAGIPLDAFDEVIVGHVLTAGTKQGSARQVAIGAGIPNTVPAGAISMVCGSGMKAIINAYVSIQAGIGSVYLAGGIESMSLAPYILHEARQGLRMGNKQIVDHFVYDALTDAFDDVHMGITAENIARDLEISREEQDEFSINSQQKAIAAVDSGAFKEEITPIKVKLRKEELLVDTDEYPNRKTSLDKLAALRPSFLPGGTVTAGNASGINDGAAFLVVVSEEAVAKYNLKPLAEIVSIGQGGVAPNVMGLGPVPAIKQALERAALTLADIDIIELNEAFAAQSLGVVKQLSEAHGLTKEQILEKTNLLGGAIALGHPLGASGARITVTLAHLLQSKNASTGLASLCIGGGMGTALVLKKI
ncbi:acetyl-CoA acetyltransferase [Clostridia bacterium]|nr:acetyl-CoA acetyltransferase [Clostridia bacterium]